MKQQIGSFLRKAVMLTGSLVAIYAVFLGGSWMARALGLSAHARVIASDTEDWVGHPFDSVQSKVDEIARAMDDNERLRLENAHLKLRVESLQFDCQQKHAQSSTKAFEQKLSLETGSRVGRTLASVDYKIPEQLTPEQLYVLGVSYFKGGENEKAAAILTFLTHLEGVAKYKNPRDWLMAGVSWYRLENYDAAEPFLDKVIHASASDKDAQAYHAQALLWKALVAERTGKKFKAQFWMRELLDHHPYSPEAAWVNGRRPASVHASVKIKPRRGASAHHEAEPQTLEK
jgi:tetratricopeptide (TPR) repeat protein